MLGQVSAPFSMAEAAFTFLLLMTVIYGSQEYTKGFVKQETVGLQGDRVLNAAMSLDSIPEGSLNINITGYEYWIEDSKFNIQYNDEAEEIDIIGNTSVSSLQGSTDAEEIQGLCLIKTGSTMEFDAEGC